MPVLVDIRESFSVPGLVGDGADVFVCVPNTTGPTDDNSNNIFWDGLFNGFRGDVKNGFSLTP